MTPATNTFGLESLPTGAMQVKTATGVNRRVVVMSFPKPPQGGVIGWGPDGTPGVLPLALFLRSNFPVIHTDYQINPEDFGVVVATAGAVATLPPASPAILGLIYRVKNVAGGNIGIATNGTDVFTTSSGQQTTETIYTDADQDFALESTGLTWILL